MRGPFATSRWFLAALILPVVSSAQQLTTDPLAAFAASWSSVRDWDITATAVVHRQEDGTSSTGTGRFVYRESAEKFFVHCATSPELGLMADLSAAYDGLRFSLHLAGTDVVSRSRSAPVDVPTALPNPLFLAFDALRPQGEDCIVCVARLGDLLAMPVGQTRVVRSTTGEVPGLIEVLSTGTVTHRIETLLNAGGVVVPSRIDRFDRAGRLESSVTLSDFEPAAPAEALVPRRIALRGFSEDGQVATRVEYLLDRVAVNSLPDDAFQLDLSGLRVWDSDDEALAAPGSPGG